MMALSRRVKVMTVSLVVTLVGALPALLLMVYGPDWSTSPQSQSKRDFDRAREKGEDLVDKIWAFRSNSGLWPVALGEMWADGFLETIPTTWLLSWTPYRWQLISMERIDD